MRFTQLLEKSAHILRQIPSHAVNIQLYQGTLPQKAFRFYVEQDELYLRDFGFVLKKTANRFTNLHYKEQFTQFSENTIETERKLLKKYLGPPLSFFNSDKTRQKIPVISAYTEHLSQTAQNASLEEAVASLIPCFWIYNELGKQMNSDCSPNNPYRAWIASYSSNQFSSSTQTIIEISNELNGVISCPLQQEKINQAFLKSAEFELQFFDAINEKSLAVMRNGLLAHVTKNRDSEPLHFRSQAST